MNNILFSNLIYRIIGNPELWHHEYIDMMNEILNSTDSFDTKDKYSELAIGDQIISRLKENNDTLMAFNTLLNKSRFKMIILSSDFIPIFHNENAKSLYESLLNPSDKKKLNASLINELNSLVVNTNDSSLQAIQYQSQQGEHLYLRIINSQSHKKNKSKTFYIILALDQNRQHDQLSSEVLEQFNLSKKEQVVVIHLIHGNSIKKISEQVFISENTVKTHLKSIYRKTNCQSQTSVIRLVLTHEAQILDSYFDSTNVLGKQNTDHQNDKFVTLASGNEICYREYGCTDGRVLIVFHNGYGCRLTIPKDHKEVCEKYQRRIIIPDRPDIGRTPQIDGHPENWPEIFEQFLEALEIKDYDLLGSVTSSKLALEVAYQSDIKLNKLILASPVFVNSIEHDKHLKGILIPSVNLIKSSRRFARDIYLLWLKSVNIDLEKHYGSMLSQSYGAKEHELFEQNGTTQLLINNFKEALANSYKGIATEMVHNMTPLDKDLSKLNIPVEIWYGCDDARITLEGVKKLSEEIPNCRLNTVEGYSEHIYYSLFDKIIA